jgi:tRNA nucleotidyltransferase (CCA-adding enzyme)
MKLKYIIEQVNHKEFLSKLLNKNLVHLNKIYNKNGYELRIVGGAVRDILSNKIPKDIDLASNATPKESLKLLTDNNIKVIQTGMSHGTITAHMDNDDYEITTLRIDKDTDGRHATIEYTKNWEEDAARRDLTFNAMSMDFNGVLYDYFEGHEDLKKGKAKFVGDTDKRVQEDYLRILRYFRFQGRTENPDFDSETLEKIKTNVAGLDNISGERIWLEMSKILSGNNLVTVIDAMVKTNVFYHIGLNKINTEELFQIKTRTDDSVLLLAAMISNIDMLNKLRDRWKFNNSEYNLMKFIISNRDKNINYSDAKRMHIMQRIDKSLISGLFEYQGKKHYLLKLLIGNHHYFQ